MSFFDILKNLVDIKFDLRKLVNINIRINSNNSSAKKEYSEKENRLEINLKKFNQTEKEEVKGLIKASLDEGYTLLEEKSIGVIDDFISKEKGSKGKEILECLKDVIPPEDYSTLRASLYLKDKFSERQDVSSLKHDIIEKAGERGKNICNICSAGYFENWIIPLYNTMISEKGYTVEKFLSFYNIVINESAFSVFVSREMSDEQVKNTILEKITKNESYGIKFINIHGIGKSNVKKIRKVIDELEGQKSFIKSVEEKDSIIIVRLDFPTAS